MRIVISVLALIFSVVWAPLGLSERIDKEEEIEVKITKDLPVVEVKYRGKKLRIERAQDTENMVDLEYALTSRPCPPYCIQPMVIAPGVETIGELELLSYLKQKTDGVDNILIIDSREHHWLNKGMIPGAINIPWDQLHPGSTNPKKLADLLQFQFGAIKLDQYWEFSNVKTLIFYCNGQWCGQSPTSIRALLGLGYPAQKIKWYRGGMQSWKLLGLTTVRP